MIVVGAASIPARVEALYKVVDSIVDQVDKIFLSLNNYTEIPERFRDHPKIHCDLLDNHYADGAKFYRVSQVDGYYISWDDDLIMPPGCVQKLIEGVDKYNGVVGLHGKYYLPPVTNFKRWAGNYRCLNTVSSDVKVNLIGSGCTCFNTNRLRLNISDFYKRNMADVLLSKVATEQGVPMMVLAHPVGYLEYVSPPRGTTIWENTHDYSEHVRIMRTFIK